MVPINRRLSSYRSPSTLSRINLCLHILFQTRVSNVLSYGLNLWQRSYTKKSVRNVRWYHPLQWEMRINLITWVYRSNGSYREREGQSATDSTKHSISTQITLLHINNTLKYRANIQPEILIIWIGIHLLTTFTSVIYAKLVYSAGYSKIERLS